MVSNHPHYTDEEWLDLITSCRNSGLTDKEWYERNHISSSCFYYHVRQLKKNACQFPAASKALRPQPVQEVVPLIIEEDHTIETSVPGQTSVSSPDTAVRISFHGLSLEITNLASRETLQNVFSALEALC